MPIDYCLPDDVSALSMYCRNKHFVDDVEGDSSTSPVDGTNPSLTTVTSWIKQVSRMMDAALAQRWFNIPVPSSNTNVLELIKTPVSRIVADMADEANQAGRFYSERVLENGLSKMAMITRDLNGFVEQNEDGLVAMGLIQHQTSGSKSLVAMYVKSARQLRRTLRG